MIIKKRSSSKVEQQDFVTDCIVQNAVQVQTVVTVLTTVAVGQMLQLSRSGYKVKCKTKVLTAEYVSQKLFIMAF
jgi:hypothetical protein